LHVLDPNLGEAAWVAKNEVWKYLAAEWIADAYFGLYRKYDFKFEYRIVIPAGSAPPRSKLSEIFEPLLLSLDQQLSSLVVLLKEQMKQVLVTTFALIALLIAIPVMTHLCYVERESS
jgi:hypothetical protein